jgi:tetratricopeptide (TPR) repeat protein
MPVSGMVLSLLSRPEIVSSTRLLGQGLSLIWTAICLGALATLVTENPNARSIGAIVATIGALFAVPVMIAGAGLYGLLVLLACGAILYLLWVPEWNNLIPPALILGFISFSVGVGFALVQASQLRNAVFFGPPTPMPELERLIFTANQFAGFLTTFYVFVIGLLLVGAFAFAQEGSGRSTAWGSLAGFVAAAVLFSAAIYLTNVTNVRIIQADIVYKQARPLDQQATRSGIAEAWDPPIAIYERALELAPNEDFYYLFLGRALLEKSGVTQDPAAQRQLLETARERLQRAQQINPLNTDHTANLARLATRWASLSTVSEARQGELVTEAKELYRDALALSPQNSVIRNEFGNLLATLDNDCDAAIETFRESLQIDPYYANTYYSLAGIFELCAAEHSPDMRDSYFQRAAELLEEGLDRDRNQNATVLLQASQLYRRAGELESAVTALEQAQELGGGQVPAWNIDFRLAEIYEEMGDSSTAQRLATRALATSPPESQAEIEAFLAELGGR